jgi:hypothetical protein
MRGSLDTRSLTRCHCARPAVGDSNNSHCLPVKAECLCEITSGLARRPCVDWIRNQYGLELPLTRTVSVWGEMRTCYRSSCMCADSFRFRRLHRSRHSGLTVGCQHRPAITIQSETAVRRAQVGVERECQQIQSHDQLSVSARAQFRVQSYGLYSSTQSNL